MLLNKRVSCSALLCSALLCSGMIATIVGIVQYQLWERWSTHRFAEPFIIGFAVLIMACAAGWRWKRPLATKVLLVWIALLAIFAGVLPVLATTLLVLAAIALGGLLLPRESALLQALLGILALAGMIGWLLLLPVHYGWGYLLLCAVLIRWRWRDLAQTLQAAYVRWNDTVSASPRMAVICVIVAGLAGIGCWLPAMQSDDLAYHLRMPWQLLEQGFYAPLPQYQVWALAPWLSDVVHALPMLMSGQETIGAVNAFWLCALAGGLWRLADCLGASTRACWMAVIVVISIPMTVALSAGMKTELPMAAILVWLFALVAGPTEGGTRFWLTLAVLTGALAAIKVPGAATAAIPLLWALFRHPWPSPAKIALVVAVALVVVGSSYVYAWFITGNPVLPLFNEWFQSPFFAPKNFIDRRWQTGFGPDLLWSMSFDTGRHGEIYAGGIGFLQIALAGAWVLALLHRNTRIITLLATAVFLLPLIPLQYVRYSYPGLVVLSAILVTTVFRVDARRAVWGLGAVCILHLAFQASSYWMLKAGAIKTVVMAMGQDEPVFKRYAPERLIAAKIRQSGESAGNVLFLTTPYAAEFGTRGRMINWYSPILQEAAREANRDADGHAWALFLQRENIRDVIFNRAEIKPAQHEGLQVIGAIQKARIGKTEWWSIPEAGRE